MKQKCGRKGLTMTRKEFYNNIIDTFETKEEETLLYRICYSVTYSITRILLRLFG